VADAPGDRPDAYSERQLAQAVLSRFDAETYAVRGPLSGITFSADQVETEGSR
jgi:hypothetical protein